MRFFFFSFWIVNDETDSESVKLRIREPNNEKPPPKPIQLKIRKNWTELVCRRIYILTWIRNYDQTTAYSDFIAGVTLGLTMIPQAIAYASIAGMDPHYGLYAAFIGTKTKRTQNLLMKHRYERTSIWLWILLIVQFPNPGAFVYIFFGTIKEVSIGPTSLMAIVSTHASVNCYCWSWFLFIAHSRCTRAWIDEIWWRFWIYVYFYERLQFKFLFSANIPIYSRQTSWICNHFGVSSRLCWIRDGCAKIR